jgi:ATP-dependent exoDNAse (exonuclease V) alpha subunit
VRAAVNKFGLLKREEAGKTLVTTPAILAEEKEMLDFAVHGKGVCRPIAVCLDGWQQALAESRLGDEQRAAVSHVLTSPDRVMIVRGAAGSGKTTLTQEAVRYMEAAGKNVVMLAPSAQASRGVLRSEGFADADTLARFLFDEKMQATAKDGVIWLDEAGLVGSRSIARLFDIAEKVNARIVLAGDKRQTASVERGAALRVLEDIAGLKLAEVKDIRRQSGEYKEAVKLLSQGHAVEGLQKLDDLGWVKLMPTTGQYEPVAEDYVNKLVASPDHEKGVLIVCPTHAEGAKITGEVRRELKKRGMVASSDREFTHLVPTQWTEAERGDLGQYCGEEILQFHRNSGDFKAGERVCATEALESARRPKPGNFAVFRKDSIQLAKGDLVRITANGKSKDGRHRLNNGAVYTCAGFTREGDIALSNGWVMDKEFGTFNFAYVATAQASQGRTVDHVIVCQSADSYPASSREGFYVAVSRGRTSATIYTDDRKELREAAERSNPRLAASELVTKAKPQLWRRMREHVARMQLAAMVAAKAATHRTHSKKELAYAR